MKSLIGHENCFQDGVKSWLHIKLKSKELNTSYQWDWYKAITPIMWLGDDCDLHN